MKYQSLYNIVFADNRSSRWKRHSLFWLVVFFYHIVRIGLMMPAVNTLPALFALVEMSLTWGVLPAMFLTYSIVYYLVPKYFNHRKYISFIAGILALIAILLSYTFVRNSLGLNSTVRQAIGISYGMLIAAFKPGFIRIFGNPPLICCLFLAFKILKNWHLEQLKTETLAKENTNAELQLLKAQIHPHFLFNTLNNIYSFSLTQSPLAGMLVEKLSNMLKYMIDECEKPLVPLEKEIKLIQDYMGLEKVRYGNRLDMQVEIKGECKGKLIAPLLMIPFVENCFKHGASVMRGQQWIKLNIDINEDRLGLYLSNSKPPGIINTNINKALPPAGAGSGGNNTVGQGIGLANVEKRLQLIYPGQHFLKTESTDDSYLVHLQINLQQFPVLEHTGKATAKLQPV